MSDIDTVVMDSLKALDPNRPIREADMGLCAANVHYWGVKRTWSIALQCPLMTQADIFHASNSRVRCPNVALGKRCETKSTWAKLTSFSLTEKHMSG